MKKFKLISMVISVMLVFSVLLVACGTKDSGSTSNATVKTTAAAPESTATAKETTANADDANKQTEDPNAVWKEVTQTKVDFAPNFISFLNESFGITVGQAGEDEAHYTNDGGKTWSQGKNDSPSCTGLDIINKDLAWTCGDGGSVEVTKDGGKTWTAVSNCDEDNIFISFVDDKTGWAAFSGPRERMGATNDGGKTWKEIKIPDAFSDGRDIAAIFKRTANDGYIMDVLGNLHITNNNGQTWSNVDLGISKLNIDQDMIYFNPYAANTQIRFFDANNGMIVFNALQKDKQSKLFTMETTDGGKTWSTKTQNMAKDFANCAIYLSHDGQFVTATNFNGQSMVLKKQ